MSDLAEAALEGLLTVLAASASFQTVSRRLKHWGQVSEQPALFLRHVGDTDAYRGQLQMTTLETEVWIYCNAGQNPDVAPDVSLTDLVNAVRACFAPDEDGRYTIGGLAHWCRIEGRSDYYAGDLGPQAIAHIPVRVTLPAQGAPSTYP